MDGVTVGGGGSSGRNDDDERPDFDSDDSGASDNVPQFGDYVKSEDHDTKRKNEKKAKRIIEAREQLISR